jgi:hypothetical protein
MLTRELAGRCGHLVAVEIDRELYHALCDESRNLPHVTLVSGDFLRFPLPESGYKVFASLPFNQTAAILRKLINAGVPPQDAYLVVQREAAERFAVGHIRLRLYPHCFSIPGGISKSSGECGGLISFLSLGLTQSCSGWQDVQDR